MKLFFTFLLVSTSSHSFSLSFKEHVELKKTVIASELPAEFLKLHRNFVFKEKRMIAGKFESSGKLSNKTYLEGLRSKLEGYNQGFRF